jgi:hypothetical protein
VRVLAGKLTYANVMATLAMFVALGGGAYAIKLKKNSVGTKALKSKAVTERKIADSAVTRSKLADGSVDGTKIADGSVGGTKIADGSVGRAKIADGSVGLTDVNDSLHQICPGGTIYLQGACIETGQRASPPGTVFFVDARAACGPSGRLPSVAELDALSRRPGISWVGFEWTSARYSDGATRPVTTVNESGDLGINADSSSGFAPFRCVFEPTG